MHRPERGRPAGILYFSTLPDLGHGGQESLLQLIRHLDPGRYRPVVVVPQAGSLARRLQSFSLAVHVVPLPKVGVANLRAAFGALRRLGRILATERIDILHSDGPRNTFYAGLLSRWAGRPLVWHVRTAEPDPHDRLLARLATRIIRVADALAPRFPAAWQREKSLTIHNGVDTQSFVPAPASGGRRSGFAGEASAIVAVLVGRVEPSKGQHRLIEALGLLRGRIASLHVLFAGEIADEPYHRRCLRRAEALGLSKRVRFAGPVGDMPGLLQAGDVLVSASSSEAFSRAILEAMATGLPVVATETGGAREAIVDGETGCLVPVGDTAALAEKLAMLAADPELRRRWGRRARERAVRRFDIRRNAVQTGEVYEELLHASAAARGRRSAS